MTRPTVRAAGTYEAHPTGELLDLTQLRENAWLRAHDDDRQSHFWIVGLLFHVDDPDVALDHMTLGTDNLVGAQGIFCLICLEHYQDNARSVCLGLRKAEEQR
jgi:hypothetical protein